VDQQTYIEKLMVGHHGMKVGKHVRKEIGIRSIVRDIFICGEITVGILNGKKVISGTSPGVILIDEYGNFNIKSLEV
jgi:hypothetical protein